VVALASEDIELSPIARLMLLWIDDPKNLQELRPDLHFARIRVTKDQILLAETKEKYVFSSLKAEKDAIEGIAELKKKDLIKADRYDDMWLTPKATYLLGTKRGYFFNTDIGPYF
jgi:hypothetical protein